jgi:hypothetical protein
VTRGCGRPRFARASLLVAGAAVLLASCGSSGHGKATGRVVTVAAYGPFPVQTVTVASSAADPRICSQDADSFASQAVQYLAHSGRQAAYPADLWYVILREAMADLRARGCDPAVLGRALERKLTARQRAALISYLPATMGESVRVAVAAAR